MFNKLEGINYLTVPISKTHESLFFEARMWAFTAYFHNSENGPGLSLCNEQCLSDSHYI